MHLLVVTGVVSVASLILLQIWRIIFVFGTPCKSKEKMNGKTVIVTGANTGIGKETAIDLATRGARVIIGCRNKQKGSEALKDIKAKAESDNVVLKKLDLASLASVRKFASEILHEEERIDVLINNAGVMFTPEQLTEDGFEMQFGVNHLGHFLLTMLLLDRIKETPNSRIVVVSSIAHYPGYLDFNDMMWKRKYNSYLSYFRSKLANVMFASELSRRLGADAGVTVYSLHPGSIKTELARHVLQGWKAIFKPLLFVFMLIFTKTPVQGAQTSIYCAVAKECEGVTGKYWDNCAVRTPSKNSMNENDCKRLFEYSAELVGLELKD